MLRRSASIFVDAAPGQVSRWISRFSSTEAGAGRFAGKSILDAAETASTSTSAAHQALGVASENYMHKLQQEAALEHELPEKPSTACRVVSLLFDALGVSLLGAAGFCAYLYNKYEVDELEEEAKKLREKSGEAWDTTAAWLFGVDHYVNLSKGVRSQVKRYTDPTLDKLLPDLAPEEVRARVKTLVLDLEDVLVHKEWTRAKGWQVYKRPGASDFIYQMGQLYEVVVYTDETKFYADPVIDRLDTYKMIRGKLCRSDTQYHNGKHVRDLSKLNRDLSNVLFVSANPDAYAFQPENALKLKKWTADPNDTTLLDLVPFLQMIASRSVYDVRDVVKAYDSEEDIVQAFKERVQRIAEQQRQATKGRLGGLFRG